MVSVTGDDGSIKILYDGKTLVLYAVEAKQYVSLPVSGGIDKALDLLEERTGTDYPLADLLSDNPAEAVASGVTSGSKVGTSTIDGVRVNISSLSKPPMIWSCSSGWKTMSGRCRAALS